MDLFDTVDRVKRCLGNSDRIICILDSTDESYHFTNSAKEILHSLDARHPRHQVLCDIVEAQYQNYGCGCKTLVVMMGLWLEQAQRLLDMGVSLTDITSEYDSILLKLSDIARESAIKVDFGSIHSNNGQLKRQTSDTLDEVEMGTQKKSSTQIEPENGESDIGWFFDGGKVPPLPTPHTGLMNFSSNDMCTNTASLSEGRADNKQIEVQNRNATESDDEFESCFDGIKFTDTANEEISQTRYPVRSSSNHESNSSQSSFYTGVIGERWYHRSELENRINEILANKKTNTRINITNHCRHAVDSRRSANQVKSPVGLANQLYSLTNGTDETYSNSSSENTKAKSAASGNVTINIELILDSFKRKASFVFPLLHEVYENQMNQNKRFAANTLHCICIPGISFNRSCVEYGIILRAITDARETDRNKNHRFLLVSGDLTPKYVHTGSKTIQKRTVLKSTTNTTTEEETWYAEMISLLTELQVTVLFVKGMADKVLLEFCNAQNIFVFSTVPSHLMIAIGEVFQVTISTYLSDCTESDVGSGLLLKSVVSDWTDNVTCAGEYISVNFREEAFQTVVICHPNEQIASLREEEFWRSVHSLHHIVSTGFVLPGAGQTELLCAEAILEKKLDQQYKAVDRNRDQNYLTKLSIAEGLIGFHSILRNILNDKESEFFCDDLPSKLAAWEAAVQMVKLTLHLDTEITTGLPDGTTMQTYHDREFSGFI